MLNKRIVVCILYIMGLLLPYRYGRTYLCLSVGWLVSLLYIVKWVCKIHLSYWTVYFCSMITSKQIMSPIPNRTTKHWSVQILAVNKYVRVGWLRWPTLQSQGNMVWLLMECWCWTVICSKAVQHVTITNAVCYAHWCEVCVSLYAILQPR